MKKITTLTIAFFLLVPALLVHPLLVSSDTPPATITVFVVDENNNPLSGATWNLTGDDSIFPSGGGGSSTVHQVYPPNGGKSYMVSGYPLTLESRSFNSIVTSDGPGRTVYINQGQNKTVTIQYTSGPVPCTVDLKVNGLDNVSVQPESSVTLTWTSVNTSGTVGSGFNTAGAIQNTSGVIVSPTETTVYAIDGIPSLGVGNCFDEVTVSANSTASGISVVSNIPSTWALIANSAQATITFIENKPGYSYVVTNSQGTGSTMSLFASPPYVFTITYTPIGPFNFSLTPPSDVSVSRNPNQSGQVQQVINAYLLSGVSQPVTFTASNLPTIIVGGVAQTVGVTYANQGCVPALPLTEEDCDATLTFTVPYSIPVGTYPITVTGSATADNSIGEFIISTSTTFNLIVQPDSSTTASCSVSPTIAKVGEPVTWTANPPGGGTSPYVFTWSGTDFPTTETANPYVTSYQSTGVKTASFTMTSGVTTATCPNVTVYVGVAPNYTEL